MQVTLEINHQKLIRSAMENQPEYSSCCTLKCTGWDYEGMVFRFNDTGAEDIQECHKTLDMPMLESGFEKMIELIKKNCPGELGHLLFDEGYWDAEWVDMLVQFSIFGKIIYG